MGKDKANGGLDPPWHIAMTRSAAERSGQRRSEATWHHPGNRCVAISLRSAFFFWPARLRQRQHHQQGM